MTKTELRIEYSDRTENYDFGESFELALENDYVENRSLYPAGIFKRISLVLTLATDLTCQDLIKHVHDLNDGD